MDLIWQMLRVSKKVDLALKRFVLGLRLCENFMKLINFFFEKKIDIKLAKIFGEQIFTTGFVHADPQ